MDEFPPTTFCLSQPVFRPVILERWTPGLPDRIQQLVGEGRFRTALDVLLPMLSEDPKNQEALTLAMLTLGVSRTQQVQAKEPLGERYLWDRRLDPLFAVCSHCRTTAWVPANCLQEGIHAKLTMFNVLGMQCRGCGYMVCSNCLVTTYVAVDTGFPSRICSSCRRASLAVPVYPTGRLPMQLERRPVPVSVVVVFREGPVPPDRDYMAMLLEQRSPDAIDDNANLIGVPIFPWPPDIQTVSWRTLKGFAHEGRISMLGLANAPAALFQEGGLNVYIVKMFRRRLE